jgi:peptidoglycan/xylan/chitin deacetylase (PgdA/CDA1 family)
MDASSSCHSPALSPIIETRTVMPPPFAHAAAPGPFIPAHAPIFMYHGIGPREDRFTVSPERLRAHLDTLREDGRTLLTFHEYAGRTPYARASRPAILTFDDSTEGQFRFLPGGGIDPSSAVGVLESYRRAHPEFRVTATFFVNTTTMRGLPAFEQPGLAERKLRFLAARGYEIAGHGTTHRDFATLRAIDARSDTDEFLSMMARAVPGYAVRSFAYPYGSLPPCAVRSTMESRFFTAHAWGGVANGQSWTVPRIETGPTTDLRAYLR